MRRRGYVLALCLGCIGCVSCSRDDEVPPASQFIGFPVLPPIANADPSIRHQEEIQLPTQLRIVRSDDRIAIEVDQDSLEVVTLEVGANMLTGLKHDLLVYRDNELVLSGSWGLGCQAVPSACNVRSGRKIRLDSPAPQRDDRLQPLRLIPVK